MKKVPCAGCGEPRWPSAHTGAPAIPTCRKCRAQAGPTHGKAGTYKRHGCRCESCVEAFRAAIRKSDAARRARLGKMVRECGACGAQFNPRANQTLCSPECRKTQLGRYGDYHSRATFYGVDYEAIDRQAVFQRDAWTCGICSLPVDPAATFPDAGSATLDHVVPMSLGGPHVMANVQLAHFYCNTSKGARLLEEVAC